MLDDIDIVTSWSLNYLQYLEQKKLNRIKNKTVQIFIFSILYLKLYK